MKIQRCVRTYEVNFSGYQMNPCSKINCELLNDYLDKGWHVVLVTPKSNYNEYILEREVEDGK